MIHVTRRYRFSASHRLHAPSLPDEENRRLFGKCDNPYGHGHDYRLEVTARGPLPADTGLLLPVDALDKLVEEEVLRPYHMRYLNEQAPEFAGRLIPTTENLVAEIGARLGRRWRHVFPGRWPELERVRIQETKRNGFEMVINPA